MDQGSSETPQPGIAVASEAPKIAEPVPGAVTAEMVDVPKEPGLPGPAQVEPASPGQPGTEPKGSLMSKLTTFLGFKHPDQIASPAVSTEPVVPAGLANTESAANIAASAAVVPSPDLASAMPAPEVPAMASPVAPEMPAPMSAEAPTAPDLSAVSAVSAQAEMPSPVVAAPGTTTQS